jgi:hypothetical protein
MAHVTITFDKETGKFKVEGHGFVGNECVVKLSDIINKLNGVTLYRRMKSELLRKEGVKSPRVRMP